MKRCLCCLLFILSIPSHANELTPAYQEGSAIGNQHANQPIEALKVLNLNELPGYQPNVSQETYYGGVTQEHTKLEADSQSLVEQSEAGRAIHDSFHKRPYFQVNPNTQSMQKLNEIAENGDAIMHGQGTSTVSCSLKPKECHYSWQEKTCLATQKPVKANCMRELHVDIHPYKTESYSLFLYRGSKNAPFNVVVNLKETNTCNRGTPCYAINKDSKPVPEITIPEHCAKISVSVVDEKGFVSVEKTATCASPSVSLAVGTCQGGKCTVPYFHHVAMTVEIEEGSEYWDDQCQLLQHKEQEGICRHIDELTCVDSEKTKMIGGLPVTRNCWKEKATYECGSQEKNTCDVLMAQGCEQTQSTCILEKQGRCMSFQQTYQCPLNQCEDNQIICGDKAFCLEGDCSSDTYSPGNEEDFKKAISALAATSSAAKDFNGKANYIFTGEKLECSKEILGAKNCCKDKGWGLDLNLLHCDDNEKKLGVARENKLVVATGEYCSKRQELPGGSVCIETSETYCVFQSKLARIIQEQGRKAQLGIDFGKGKKSDCSGITPEQLQLIHFENINFSEFYEEIKHKTPDYQQTIRQVNERVNQFYNQGDAHA